MITEINKALRNVERSNAVFCLTTVSRDKLVNQNVCGNICESGDLLAKDRMLPEIKKGDLACVLDAGAYGYSMCSTYNSRPRPAEVLVCKDGSIKTIRKRETYEDLFRLM